MAARKYATSEERIAARRAAQREYRRKWKSRNPERVRAYNSSEKVKSGRREKYYADHERRLKTLAEYRSTHRAILAEKESQRYQRIRESKELKAYRERTRDRFRDARLVHSRNYRFKGRGEHTLEQIQNLWEEQGRKCAVPNCQYPISDKPGRYKYHVDHIIPARLGATNDISNLQILCNYHNVEKSDRHPAEWGATVGIIYPDELLKKVQSGRARGITLNILNAYLSGCSTIREVAIALGIPYAEVVKPNSYLLQRGLIRKIGERHKLPAGGWRGCIYGLTESGEHNLKSKGRAASDREEN